MAALFVFVATAVGAAAPPPRMLLLDAAVAGGDVVAVGERGTMLRSADSGRTWRALPRVTRATLTAIGFAPGDAATARGWAVGHEGVILATSDGGRTWTKQFQLEDLEQSFLDVLALDAQHAIAVGAFGLFHETKDGGRTWPRRKIADDDHHLNRLTRGPTGTLYLAGERGTLLRSRDDGATWQAIAAPYSGSFFGVLPLDGHTLLAHGLRGHVFRSTDDGGTWQPVTTPDPVLIATATQLKGGSILVAGYAGTLLASRDGGKTLTPLESPTKGIARLLELPDGSVLAVGEAGATVLPPLR